MTSVDSGPTQFAGRTTINSGTATVTVSTRAVKSDSLIHLGFEGNANIPIIAGTANITSNAAAVTVSNAAVASDSLVIAQARQGGVAQTSGVAARTIEVVSLASGWFSVGWQDGVGIANRQTTVGYVVYPADGPPAPLEVKTLVDGAYFVIGRQDGRAIARDTKILWQITNVSHH